MRQDRASASDKGGLRRRLLRWLNLRPEESERTFLMFAFYTLTSVGILWLEVSVAALFLGEYGAESLPWIYIASAGIGAVLGTVYSWMQRFLSLQQVIVFAAVLMALPLFLFWLGLQPAIMGAYVVFLMRLWLEAIYVLNDLNTSITANQLFTIREIKRAYPLISSGILAADVLSGISLPFLRSLVGLPNVILMAGIMLLLGAGILLYLTHAYRQYFPDSSRHLINEEEASFNARRLQGSQRHYVVFLFAFFIMVQVLAVLLDFQYLGQLEQGMDVDTIADFLAIFSAILGTFELFIQWFVCGRVIERMGVFWVATLPPALLVGLSLLSLTGLLSLFLGVIMLKFVDELLRYTLVASTRPVLFQAIPEANRSQIQSFIQGIAEPLTAGVTGAAILLTIWGFRHISASPLQSFERIQNAIFLTYTAIFSAFWLFTVLKLRKKYLEVLVSSSDRGQFGLSKVDVSPLKRELIDKLNQSQTDEELASCIDFLTSIDPYGIGDVLGPRLPTFSPDLQYQSLGVMMQHPVPTHVDEVRVLTTHPLSPEVLSAALRYIWLNDPDADLGQLQSYLSSDVEPVVRGTAAALMLRLGNSQQKAEATDVLRRMLTSKQEHDRVMGCRALGDTTYLQFLRIYIKPLLQDPSLRVRCAMLEAIAATHLEEYYPALLRGLYYRSTRSAARRALVRLGDEAIPWLVEFAEDAHHPQGIRSHAWVTLGQIETPKALNLLVTRLSTSWGATRRTLLRVLLKVPNERGIETVLDQLGSRNLEGLINQELLFLAHLYASLLDLNREDLVTEEVDLLRRSLRDSEVDAIERMLLLMRFLYKSDQIQIAALNLQSDNRDSVARALEILDTLINLPHKSIILNILDRQSDAEKIKELSGLLPYQPMNPSQRLRHLMELRYFLSDWTLACCVHLARRMRWGLTVEQILACLQYPSSFVREAVLAYLQVASPQTLQRLLPLLQQDPDPSILLQVKRMMTNLSTPSLNANR